MNKDFNKMSKSDIKTWFKLNGFKLTYSDNWRNVMKYGCGVFSFKNRYYRVRNNGPDSTWVVDVSEPIQDFDRWANSALMRDIPLQEFMKEYGKT
jgi:hypothetical protein